MMTDNKITIIDIARVANVSPATVSRVLRGTTAVSEKKHQAVLSAVEELDYRPNIFAQSLASGQSMTIGVLTQNFGSAFYDGILRGILRGLEETGYSALFADGRWDAKAEEGGLRMLIDRQVDGVILIGGHTSDVALQEIASQIPLLIVGREVPTLLDHCLYIDNFTAAYEMTRYLLDQGHRHIAHISGEGVGWEQQDVYQRYLGYKQALLDAGITPDPQLLIGGTLLQQSGMIAVEGLLARGRPFSAIFAANDQMAFGARLALFRRGIRVPEDVSIAGFDDQESAPYMIPPLTTVRQPSSQLGEAAAKTILEILKGALSKPQVFKGELVLRESVARGR